MAQQLITLILSAAVGAVSGLIGSYAKMRLEVKKLYETFDLKVKQISETSKRRIDELDHTFDLKVKEISETSKRRTDELDHQFTLKVKEMEEQLKLQHDYEREKEATQLRVRY